MQMPVVCTRSLGPDGRLHVLKGTEPQEQQLEKGQLDQVKVQHSLQTNGQMLAGLVTHGQMSVGAASRGRVHCQKFSDQ